MLLHRFLTALGLCCALSSACAQSAPQDSIKKAPVSTSKWYDKLSLRGYAQVRYNRLLETNPELKCEQCDKGVGKNQGFEFRRARLVFSGDVHERLFVYLQFDYSSDAGSLNKHFLQVRDAYFDYAFDAQKEFRVRFGQSKVPYGFENIQSSQNRLPYDRADAMNSAVPNERDLGVFLFYAPRHIRARFKHLVDDGLKGSGDYGVAAFGLYNGQTMNKPEQNDNLHAVARLSYPFKVGKKQIIEPGIQAFSGRFTLDKDQLSAGVKAVSGLTYLDRRVALSAVLFPQPFGILAEYNIGQSPGFDSATDSIRVKNLHGGFVTFNYRTQCGKGLLLPYVRFQAYDGGKKQELDARYYTVRETELGIEWLPIKNLELTIAYVISSRQYNDFKSKYDESGRYLRLQVQANY